MGLEQAATMGGGDPIGNIGSALMGNGGADAAQNAQMQKQAEARRQYNEIKGITDTATASGIASFQTDIANQDKELSRQEQMVSQIDPTIIEASQQALKLMRGEQAQTLGPLQQQRDYQRQQLTNTLRQQMGPGAETSSAGMQALTNFDRETAGIMSGAQQQAIQNLGSTANQFNSVNPNINQTIALRSQYGQGASNLGFKQAQTLMGTYGGLMDTAGADQTSAVLQGQQRAGFGSALLGGAFSLAGASMGSGGGRQQQQQPQQNGNQVGGSYSNFGNMS